MRFMSIALVLTLFCQPVVAQSTENIPGEELVREEVSFANGDVVLSGVLTMPPGGGAFPAAILVSGSGPQDRDGFLSAIPDYRPFRDIAEHLARSGFAVLRYDDRGVGDSTGEYGAGSEADFIADAEAALAYLCTRDDIAHERIGFIGHSEGSLIAASVAGNNQNAAFVISLAGGAIDGYTLLLRQAERQALANGMSEAAVAAVLQQQRRIFDLAQAQDWEALTAVVTDVTLKRLEAMPAARTAGLGDLEAFASRRAAQSIRNFQHPRYQFILNHDFGADWARVSVPVLGLFGELDVQVDAEQNVEALTRIAKQVGNDDVTTVILPEANHLFIAAGTGSVAEYATLPKVFIPDFLPILTSWLQERMLGN